MSLHILFEGDESTVHEWNKDSVGELRGLATGDGFCSAGFRWRNSVTYREERSEWVTPQIDSAAQKNLVCEEFNEISAADRKPNRFDSLSLTPIEIDAPRYSIYSVGCFTLCANFYVSLFFSCLEARMMCNTHFPWQWTEGGRPDEIHWQNFEDRDKK